MIINFNPNTTAASGTCGSSVAVLTLKDGGCRVDFLFALVSNALLCACVCLMTALPPVCDLQSLFHSSQSVIPDKLLCFMCGLGKEIGCG